MERRQFFLRTGPHWLALSHSIWWAARGRSLYSSP